MAGEILGDLATIFRGSSCGVADGARRTFVREELFQFIEELAASGRHRLCYLRDPVGAPAVGQHTVDVLRECLGYEDDRLSLLAESGAFGARTVGGLKHEKVLMPEPARTLTGHFTAVLVVLVTGWLGGIATVWELLPATNEDR